MKAHAKCKLPAKESCKANAWPSTIDSVLHSQES